MNSESSFQARSSILLNFGSSEVTLHKSQNSYKFPPSIESKSIDSSGVLGNQPRFHRRTKANTSAKLSRRRKGLRVRESQQDRFRFLTPFYHAQPQCSSTAKPRTTVDGRIKNVGKSGVYE